MKKLIVFFLITTIGFVNAQEKIILKGLTRKEIKALKKKKKRWTTKGRQIEDKFLDEVKKLFSETKFKRDELIEYLHKLQDNFGVLFDKHLVALSSITNLPMSEIYEVATFYAHFNIEKNKNVYNPIKIVRVCESLTCELFGAKNIDFRSIF